MIPRSQFIAAALSLTWLAGACSGTILEKPVFKGPIDRELAVTFADERIIGHTRNGPLSILSWDASGFPATEPQFKSPVGSAQPFSDRWGRVFTLTDYSRNLNLMRLDPYEVATTFEVPFGVQKESLRNMTSESHLCFHRTESEFINTPGGEPYEGAWVYHQFLDVLDLATGTRVSHPLGSDDSSQGLKSILTGRTICIQKARTYSSDASLETWDIVSGERTASREIDLGFEIAHFAFADGIAALGKNVGVYDGHFLEPIHFVSIETGQTTTLEPPPLEANTTSHFDYRSSSILPTLNGFWIAYYREHTTIVRHVTLGGPGFYKIDFEGEVDYYNPSGLAAGLVAYDDRRIAVTLEFWNLGSDPGRDIAIFDRGDRRPEVRFHAEDVRDGSAEALMRVTLDRFSPKGASFDFETRDGSALAGQDYHPTSGSISFAPGEMMKTIRIPLIRDLVPEADESFGMVISNVVGARPRTTPAPITIAASGLNHVQVDDLSGAPEGFQPSKSTGYQTSQSRRVAMMDPYMVIPKAVTTAEPPVLAVFGSRDGAYRCTLANPPSPSSGEMWICDDTRIAHVSPEGRIRVWQVSNGGLIRDAIMPELPLPDNPSFQPFPTHMGGMEIGFPTVSADGTVSASIVDLAKGTIREAHLPSSLMTRGTPVIVSGSETFAVATMELILNEDADPRWSRLAIEFFDKATMEPFGSYRGNLFSTTLSDTSRLVLQPVDCGEHFYLAVPDAKCFDLRSGEPVWTTSDLVDRYPESRNRKVTGGDGFLLIGGSTNLNDDPEAILVDPDSLARLGSVPRSSPTIVGAMLISGRTMEVDYLSLERELPAIRFNFSDLYIDEGFSIEAEMAEPFDREVTARWSLDTTAPSPVFPRIETYLEADGGLMTVLPGTKTTERVLMKRTTELWPEDLTIAVNTLGNPGGIPYQPATHLLPVTRSAMPSPPGQRLSGRPETEIGTVDRLEVSDRWVVAIVNGARSPVTGFTTDYRLDVYDRDSLTHRRSIQITTDLHDGRFGTAGAIHGDLLLISAPAEDGAENPNLLGRVHLFNLADGSLVKTFTNTLRILNFSESIASGDNYFAIGAWGEPPYLASFPNSVRAGFVVYRWSDLEVQWTMTSGGQQLGTSLQFDGDTLYASAPNHTGRDGLTTLYDVGAIFVYDPATRRQIGEIYPPVPQSRTEFGKEIHLRNGRLAINWAGLIYQNTQKRGGILIYDLAAGEYSGFVGTTDRGTVPTHSMALSDRHLVTRGREFVISDAETGETRVTASIDIVANSMTRWVFGPGDEFFYGVDHEVYRGSLSELAGFRAWQTLRPPDSPESGFNDYLNHHLKLAQDPISSLSSDSPGSVTTLGIQPPRDIPRDVICHLQWSADLSRWKTLASANSDGVWEGADGEIEEDDSARLILDVHDPSGFFRFDFEPHPLLAE